MKNFKVYTPFLTIQQVKEKIIEPKAVESLYWDYKEIVGSSYKAENLAKDICAFSNSYGGSLLIGVSEKENSQKIAVANGFAP